MEFFTYYINYSDTDLKVDYLTKKAEKEIRKSLRGNQGRQLKRRINQLEDVNILSDMYKFKGARLEKLSNNRNEQYSVRINDRYRLCFLPRNGTEPSNITEIDIVEFTNHYE